MDTLKRLNPTRQLSLQPEAIGAVVEVTKRLGYFCLGPVSTAYRAINAHVNRRLRQWLCKKHKVQGTGIRHYPDRYLYETLGLIKLPKRTRNLPCAKA
jgi:hypothetical protein